MLCGLCVSLLDTILTQCPAVEYSAAVPPENRMRQFLFKETQPAFQTLGWKEIVVCWKFQRRFLELYTKVGRIIFHIFLCTSLKMGSKRPQNLKTFTDSESTGHSNNLSHVWGFHF